MGRRQNSRSQTPAAPKAPEPRLTPARAVMIAVVVVVLGVGALFYLHNGGDDAAQAAATSGGTMPAADQTVAPPASAALGPHPQQNLPPLPFGPTPPSAPTDVIYSVYRFAAEHPEILSYVPCYCGCERAGHRGNEDCFVTARDANGDVTEWEPHGMT